MTRYEALSRALEANAGQSVRAERLRRYSEFYVDAFSTKSVIRNTNQLIVGRRGSGKTLLLGTLNDRIRSEFPTKKVVSFVYDATQFRSSSGSDATAASIKEQTHAFFHAFIEKLCTDIVQLADDVLFTKSTWLRELTLAGESRAARRDQLLSAVIDLMDAVSYGIESPMPSDIERTEERTRHDESTRSGSVGFGATVSRGPAPIKAALDYGRESSRRSEQIAKDMIKTQRRFSPGRVRELVTEIVDILGLEYMVILIDEWMSLKECQVDFAERLRQCFFGESKIAIKIAADQFQGKFNNFGQGHNFRGLELGADIFLAVDLDLPFRDGENGRRLYTEALYRRLLYFSPDLENYFGNPLANAELFVDSLFSTRRAFNEICIGSNGLCRDFLELFDMCARRLGYTVAASSRITHDIVWQVLVDRSQDTFDRAKRSIDTRSLLFEIITPHILNSKSRYFVVESNDSRFTPILNDLMTKRVIHPVTGGSLHPSVSGMYDCYEIDYGIFINLMRAAEFQTGVAIKETTDRADLADVTASTVDQFALDLSRLQGTNVRLCDSCGSEFSTDAKAYVVRRMCPNCFADQPPEGE